MQATLLATAVLQLVSAVSGRAGNEPSRSLKLHNHGEGPYYPCNCPNCNLCHLSSPSRGLLRDCECVRTSRSFVSSSSPRRHAAAVVLSAQSVPPPQPAPARHQPHPPAPAGAQPPGGCPVHHPHAACLHNVQPGKTGSGFNVSAAEC